MPDRHWMGDAVAGMPAVLVGAPAASVERFLVEVLAATFNVPRPLWAEATICRQDLQLPVGLRRVESMSIDYHGAVLARAVIKSGLADRALRALPSLEALRRERCLPIPALYALERQSRLALTEWACGRPLDRLIRAGFGRAAAERAGAAVAVFHSAPAAHFELLSLRRLLGDLHPAPGELPGKLGLRAAELSAAIGAMRDPVTRRTGLCHRDLHPRQLLDDGARVMIVDLDQVGRGHPALDLANFRAYLTARIPHHCVAIEEAFLAGYAARTRFYFPGDDVESEAIYRAFTFLRLAVKTCRGARPGWECTASELLDSGERSLFGAEACL